MITTIRVLDETTANKIAAGEVVERPASVVKELVENSIDAQSHFIEVEIVDGGINYIRVSDDGIGMCAADARLAILRHATSKIRTADDLYNIQSLGFRGEALPSIAAVSRFTLTTRLHSEPIGTYIEIQGGQVTDMREAGRNVGTTVTVSDLFFNTPARRKFLKTPATESAYIHDILGKIALARPDIAIKLINNKRQVLATTGTGRLLDAAASLYGYKAAAELLPLDYSDGDIHITGYVGKPHLVKSSRQWQTWTVNGRTISSRMLSKALDNAYHSLLPKNGFPLAIIQIVIPSDKVDVNVHPQKSEVKFSDEQAVFRAVYKAVLSALQAAKGPQQIAATVSLPVSSPAKPAGEISRPTEKRPVSPVLYAPRQSGEALWREETLPVTTARETMQSATELPAVRYGLHQDTPGRSSLALRALGQISDCFIVAAGSDGLYIIDQHAAHERILYEHLAQGAGRAPAQQLLVPRVVALDERDIELVLQNEPLFYELGFRLEQIGPRSMRLLEAPSDIPGTEIEGLLREILGALHNMQTPKAHEIRHIFLQTAACRSAIKAGENLNMRQMQALIDELCSTNRPYTCPHGRPAIVRFTDDDLAKMFKRQ
ncbi:DNA mismatch repair endonuclease MutL [Sporolituus thermophilus]|uniref:DNA mismatch repair protein MutL n=1 Tax=Sporolituus thermophilus DSM 23256 TaxID=1123285 RepID=A0A1G7M270_9FIRM|nr:DNA mismatch repair endonuclease MutL [Sporolituus thermophilus]SDF55892.1 DNA mismatch repair protein MutL [Sporolituus thermophilus DSM 23256]